MRKGGRINSFFTKLALVGMAFVIAGCGAGGETQNDGTAAKITEAEDTAQTQADAQSTVQVQNPQEWEWDAEDEETLRRAFAQDFGGRAGVCVPMAAISDEARMELVKGQFNSVTMENEMKPESFLGNKPNIGEDGFPVLDFTVPDMMMKDIKAYNDTVGMDGKKIRVRGHVLVWHSQTPEWFFHEDYNENNPYVDKETMLSRMENYIKDVMEHYEGADSEFKGMIYAWDVVNEAVNDSDGGVRTDSSWFNIFHNFDFVEWAFVYANQYAPGHIKLFYNDYNDTNAKKADGICKLIEKIKANPDARIDGMGMQGHYDMNFSASEFEESARKYAAVVDEIQITELDLKSSTDYDGTNVEEEYQKQAYVYKSLYDAVVNLKQEGVPITAIVFWGTDDGHSWLQSANFVGGSADGTRMQCPLLFDKDYQAKPAFWAFVDGSRLAPIRNDTKNDQDNSSEAFGKLVLKPFADIAKGTASVDGIEEGAWDRAQELTLSVVSVESGQPEASATAKALWDEKALYVLVKVTDPDLDVSGQEVHTQDSVEVFIDEKNDKTTDYKLHDKQYRVNCENARSFNGNGCKEDYITSEVRVTDDGYVAEMAIIWTELQPEEGDLIGFEVQINDCKNGNRLGMLNWYDTTNTCWTSPASYGTARLTVQ